MPTLEWIGKDKVINHHQEVPYRVLERQYSFDADGQHDTDNGSENMIIRGDNLEALKALLPRYEGRVKCIYIDPPYNTGNEGWVYNDNVNDPKIKKWLGEVVGKEGEDLTRHDKWLCMMYPRLKLLQKLLADDGVIFISIDDTECANLKLVCDEIFGSSNFVSDVIWQHSLQANGYGGKFVSQFNHTIVYSKSSLFVLGNLPRSKEDDKLYKNPDNDPRGPWRTGYCVNGLYRPNLKYEIITPRGNRIEPPDKGWRWSQETLQSKIDSGEIIFNSDETAIIHKLYLADLQGKVPENIWVGGVAGTTRQATAELKAIFDGTAPFDTPKPTKLIERIIQIATDADSITAERVKRVIRGYGEGKNAVEGTGGDFSFYDLGEPLLIGENLNETVGTEKIREYVWFMETKSPYAPAGDDNPYFLGCHNDTSYYFYYEPERITVLNYAFLSGVTERSGGTVIYADRCALGEDKLAQMGIVFKKIPRDISRL